MEENRPFMPPPPPHLRQKPEEKVTGNVAFAEEKTVKDANLVLDETMPEMDVQQSEMIEDFQPQGGFQEGVFENAVSQGKKKFDWQSIINWTGLIVSAGFVVLFLFLLIK